MSLYSRSEISVTQNVTFSKAALPKEEIRSSLTQPLTFFDQSKGGGGKTTNHDHPLAVYKFSGI